MTVDAYRFYREGLSPVDQQAYDKLLQGMMQCQRSIDVGAVKDAAAVFAAVNLDNPTILCTGQCSTRSGFGKASMEPSYTVSSLQMKSCVNTVQTSAQNIVNRVYCPNNSWQTLLNLHDEFIGMTTYDMTKPHVHTAYGVFATGYGVCEGIAKAFKVCCDILSIKCICATGNAKSNLQSLQYAPHCWNKVCIADKWYNIDVTFDLSLSQQGAIHHDFFLVADKDLSFTHRPDKITVECEFDGNYYGRKGFVYRNKEELARIISYNIDKLPLNMELKFAPDVDLSNINQDIQQAVSTAFNKSRHSGGMSLSVMAPLRTAYLIVR